MSVLLLQEKSSSFFTTVQKHSFDLELRKTDLRKKKKNCGFCFFSFFRSFVFSFFMRPRALEALCNIILGLRPFLWQ